jgi:hypothetical protein
MLPAPDKRIVTSLFLATALSISSVKVVAMVIMEIKRGKHNLVILGAKVRPGERVFFGHSIDVLLERTSCSLLVVSS